MVEDVLFDVNVEDDDGGIAADGTELTEEFDTTEGDLPATGAEFVDVGGVP